MEDIEFQFHHGTIGSIRVNGMESLYRYFNSTTVRLGAKTSHPDRDLWVFQFHHGTIGSQ